MPDEIGSTRLFGLFNELSSPLKGIESFVNRIPVLAAQEITQGGSTRIGGFKCELIAPPIPSGEADKRIILYDSMFYWGWGENEVKTRMSAPIGTTSEAVNNIIPDLEKALKLGYSKIDSHKRKFKEGRIEKIEQDIVVSLFPLQKNDAFTGNVAPYWTSYWQGVMHPLVKTAFALRRSNS